MSLYNSQHSESGHPIFKYEKPLQKDQFEQNYSCPPQQQQQQQQYFGHPTINQQMIQHISYQHPPFPYQTTLSPTQAPSFSNSFSQNHGSFPQNQFNPQQFHPFMPQHVQRIETHYIPMAQLQEELMSHKQQYHPKSKYSIHTTTSINLPTNLPIIPHSPTGAKGLSTPGTTTCGTPMTSRSLSQGGHSSSPEKSTFSDTCSIDRSRSSSNWSNIMDKKNGGFMLQKNGSTHGSTVGHSQMFSNASQPDISSLRNTMKQFCLKNYPASLKKTIGFRDPTKAESSSTPFAEHKRFRNRRKWSHKRGGSRINGVKKPNMNRHKTPLAIPMTFVEAVDGVTGQVSTRHWLSPPITQNMFYPYSNLLVTGIKTIETRFYDLPKECRGVRVGIVQIMPKDRGATRPPELVGEVIFGESKRYHTKEEWEADYEHHRVPLNHKRFGWKNDRQMYGWVVKEAVVYDEGVRQNSLSYCHYRQHYVRNFFAWAFEGEPNESLQKKLKENESVAVFLARKRKA